MLANLMLLFVNDEYVSAFGSAIYRYETVANQTNSCLRFGHSKAHPERKIRARELDYP